MSDVGRRQAPRVVARWLPITLVVLAAACAGEEKGPNGELKLRGTVHRMQSADGATCWQLETKHGKYELQPAQVPAALLADGATAVVMAKPRAGGSFCKVGDIVDVVKVDSLTAPTSTAGK
jgi:hypothetical protein